MDPQNAVPQPTIPQLQPTPTPVQSPIPVQEKKSSKLVWLIAGIVVLLIGIGIGLFLRH